jgi:hypothetical protein
MEEFPAMNKEGRNGFGHGLLYSRALYQHFAGLTDRNPEKFTEVASFFSEIRCRKHSIKRHKCERLHGDLITCTGTKNTILSDVSLNSCKISGTVI